MINGQFDTLQGYLRDWDGRRRQQELLRWLPRGLLAGLLVGLAAALLSRWRPLLTRSELAIFALAAVLLASSVAGFAILLWRRTTAAQAHFGDRQFGLRERMTAAVEIQTGRLVADDEMAARQLADAVGAAAGVDAARQLPLRGKPADWLPALAAALALAVALWLPNPQEAILLEQRAVGEAIAQQVETLSALAEEIAANETLTPEQQADLLQPLEEALAALQEPGLSREEAVAGLSEAEAELRSLSEEFENTDLNAALAQAAASLNDSGAAADLAAALQAGEPGEAGAAAAAMAGALGDLSAAEQAALAERLAEAAAGLQSTDAELAGALERAAEALAEGDIAAAGEALGEASAALGRQEQAAAAAAQASSAAEQLGAARGEMAQGGEGQQPGGETAEGGSGPGQTGSEGTEGGAPGAGQNGGGVGGPAPGGPGPGGGHVENVFVPEGAAIDGPGQELELEVKCLADPQSCGLLGGQTPSDPEGQAAGGSLVPYDQVFGDYRDAAIEALAGGDIPIGLQDIIRDYFSALEP